MCRNIKQLYNFEPPATDDEIRAAATQYIRKISGFQKPSQINEEVFNQAVGEITRTSKKLLDSLTTKAKPKNREEEARKARERNRLRFSRSK